MNEFLAGDEGGDGFGVEVIRSSIPLAGRELREDTAADTFLTAGGPEAVRLMSWEVFGIPDISSISFRMPTALLTAPLSGLALSAGRLSPALVTPALGRAGSSESGQRGPDFILFLISVLKRRIFSAVRWETVASMGEKKVL